MKVDYSKAFIKASKKLSGKTLDNLRRIGNYRAFFTCLIEVVDGVVKFEYLVSRGQAYSKEMIQKLRSKD